MIDLSGAANPDWAAQAVSRIDVSRLSDDPEAQRRFAVVIGASQALGDLLAARPELLEQFDDKQLPAWTVSDVTAAALASDRSDGPLGRVQQAGRLRIAIRDLMGLVDTATAAAELADLADGILGAALQIINESDPIAAAELGVVAMGKLGGRELNYVSDIDVLFVHRGDDAAAQRLARAFLQLTGGHGSDGPVYEMDANLRPEGRNGPLSRTVPSYQAYYQRWAKTWEFQALLKMRPVAGPDDLLAHLHATVQPLVWPDARGSDAVNDIQAMKHRVEQSKPVQRDGARQLKLAPGGLRDIEFAVQLLQMVHGPADSTLRLRGTLPALQALAEGGYVDEGDANLFSDFYVFLRTVEHRLQLRHLRRTHTIPADEPDIARLARTMGFRDLPTRTAKTEFEAELTRVRSGVRRLHQQLFYRPLLSTIASWGADQRVVDGGGLDPEAARARLQALAFDAPGQAIRHLEALTTGSDRTAKQLRVLLPAMLEALAETPDPDGGLAALRGLVAELRGNPRLLRLLRDSPSAARLLTRVLGRAPRLGEWFTRQPEVLRLYDEPDALQRHRTREELHRGAAGLVRRGGGKTGSDALRRFKRREALRTALRDVTDQVDVVQVGHELTWLGEGLLQAAVATVGDDGVDLAVIALGRFGAAELNHSSDLDVIFVHEGEAEAAERTATAVIDFLSTVTPEGAAFRIDTGLRPEGRDGPLTRSLESHQAYYRRWASHWELLAMTQARVVAGDHDLGQQFVQMLQPLVYTDPVDHDRLRAIRLMKARLEAERAGGVSPRPRVPRPRAVSASRPRHGRRGVIPAASSRVDVKLGPGGLSDVEWTVQLLALSHGGSHPQVRGPGTMAVLQQLTQIDAITPEEAEWLRAGWLLQSRLRNILYLVGERDTSILPAAPDRLARVAHAAGFDSSQQLSQAVDRARRRVRKVFDHRFFETRP